jgi:ribosomal protein L37AE/L43A
MRCKKENPHCIDCGKELSAKHCIRCLKCSILYKSSLIITKNYCCINCGNKISDRIALYGSGKCGKCSQKGKVISYEARQNMSKAHKGVPLSKKHSQNISKALKGKKHSKEAKIKMSKAHLGKKLSKEHCKNMSIAMSGKNHPLYGKHHSKKTRLKMSKAQRGEKNHMFGKHPNKETLDKRSKALKGKYLGENSSQWQNGISFFPYNLSFNKELKHKIRERDKFICQLCYKNEKVLNRALSIHHIDYNKENSTENNLIGLCVKCHSKTNSNRDYWFAYFTYIMENKCFLLK